MPAALQSGASDAELVRDAIRKALLPPDWNPSAVYVRDGHLGPRGFELSPGGEIGIRLSGLLTEIAGIATVAEDIPMPVDPVVRVFYYKGPKLDGIVNAAIRAANRQLEFKAWLAERDGWLVVTLDRDSSTPAVVIRFTAVKSADRADRMMTSRLLAPVVGPGPIRCLHDGNLPAHFHFYRGDGRSGRGAAAMVAESSLSA